MTISPDRISLHCESVKMHRLELWVKAIKSSKLSSLIFRRRFIISIFFFDMRIACCAANCQSSGSSPSIKMISVQIIGSTAVDNHSFFIYFLSHRTCAMLNFIRKRCVNVSLHSSLSSCVYRYLARKRSTEQRRSECGTRWNLLLISSYRFFECFSCLHSLTNLNGIILSLTFQFARRTFRRILGARDVSSFGWKSPLNFWLFNWRLFDGFVD